MNYQWHYNKLIERGKNRVVDGYTENHHIVPRCMDGTDDPENLVRLTPEEHYVAHQLLVKMYPNHPKLHKLVYALNTMTRGRPSNKRYGWVKRRYQKVCKARVGEKNGSFGRSWYHNPETLESVKCLPDEIPKGFVKGRRLKPNSLCLTCGKNTGKLSRKYCPEHLTERKRYLGKLGRNSHSEEIRKKMSESHLGKSLSEETKKKISDGVKKYYASVA